jgi:adenosylcobinamide-GDP ribazoletransferase
MSARGARAAFVFLTRIPVGGAPYAAADWAWAPAYFPLVGGLVGAALAALHLALRPLGPLADASLVLAASMMLTGALHEDGLADSSDALGGGSTRERVLEILKDSRIGTYGACALLVSFVARAALLVQLGRGAGWALVLVGCAARVGPVWQMATIRYVSSTGAKSRALAAAGLPQALTATAWMTAAAACALRFSELHVMRLIALSIACAAVTTLTSWRYIRRVGGITGDFLGATEQLCEIAGYAVLAWGS